MRESVDWTESFQSVMSWDEFTSKLIRRRPYRVTPQIQNHKLVFAKPVDSLINTSVDDDPVHDDDYLEALMYMYIFGAIKYVELKVECLVNGFYLKNEQNIKKEVLKNGR